jgi:outer membrane protein assembly factor BamB
MVAFVTLRRPSRGWPALVAAVVAAAVGLGLPAGATAGTPVLTRSYDNGRNGANTTETVLTPALVASRGMQLVHRITLATGNPPVADNIRVEAQPLYVPGLMMNDGQVHDVLYIVSMSNNVWAFDANTFQPIWPKPVNAGPPFLPQPGDPATGHNINMSVGFLSTPAIDLDAGVMYLAHMIAPNNQRVLQVEALNLTDGQKRHPSLAITGSVVNKAGTTVTLSQVQTQRAALVLTPLRGKATPPAHKMLYVGFTGSDGPPAATATEQHHGWMTVFDVDDWKQVGAWTPTPSSVGGGVWQGAQGPAADENGNVYFLTGNGGYLVQNGQTHDFVGVTDFAEAFVKLTVVGAPAPSLNIVDWYIPFRDTQRKIVQGYDYKDQDLSSGGAVLPSGTNVLIGAGKDGVLFVLKRNKLGNAVHDNSKLLTPPVFFTFDPDQTIASYKNADPSGDLDFVPMLGVKTHHLHGTPVYWKSSALGPLLFVWGENGNLRAFSIDVNTGKTKLLAHGAEFASADLADPKREGLGGMPGGMLTLSANGGDVGIVWATAPLTGDANLAPEPGIVRAYDATQFAGKNADNVPRLALIWQASGFTYSKFCPPVVADGKLFVATYDGTVDVYTLKPRAAKTRPPG